MNCFFIILYHNIYNYVFCDLVTKLSETKRFKYLDCFRSC